MTRVRFGPTLSSRATGSFGASTGSPRLARPGPNRPMSRLMAMAGRSRLTKELANRRLNPAALTFFEFHQPDSAGRDGPDIALAPKPWMLRHGGDQHAVVAQGFPNAAQHGLVLIDMLENIQGANQSRHGAGTAGVRRPGSARPPPRDGYARGQSGAVQLAAGDARAAGMRREALAARSRCRIRSREFAWRRARTKHQPCDQLVAHLEPEVLALDFRKRLEGSAVDPTSSPSSSGARRRDTGADDERVAAGRAEPVRRPKPVAPANAVRGRAGRADCSGCDGFAIMMGSLGPADIRKPKIARIRDIAKPAPELPGRETIAQLDLRPTGE